MEPVMTNDRATLDPADWEEFRALAHRMVQEGSRFAAWNREAAGKLARNLAEYWTEEQPLLAPPAAVREFLTDVDQLRVDLARLEKRVAALTRTR